MAFCAEENVSEILGTAVRCPGAQTARSRNVLLLQICFAPLWRRSEVKLACEAGLTNEMGVEMTRVSSFGSCSFRVQGSSWCLPLLLGTTPMFQRNREAAQLGWDVGSPETWGSFVTIIKNKLPLMDWGACKKRRPRRDSGGKATLQGQPVTGSL